MLEHQNESISCEKSSNFTLCSFKVGRFPMSFLVNLKIGYLKIDVSCEAVVNFQHISQNATLAWEFARCHHWMQP